MPCDDVTELLELRADAQDRLLGYRLAKRTCGRAVGSESLIGEILAGMDAAAILAIDAEAFIEEQAPATDVEAFLLLKHLFAVQGALRVLTGEEPGGAGSPCAVACMAYDGDVLVLEAHLAVDVIAERIKACGACKGCGTKRKAAAT
jgi:hypothetical protein